MKIVTKKELTIDEKILQMLGPIDADIKSILKWSLGQAELKTIYDHAIVVTEEKKK